MFDGEVDAGTNYDRLHEIIQLGHHCSPLRARRAVKAAASSATVQISSRYLSSNECTVDQGGAPLPRT